MADAPFPPLADGWETTRATLHAYCRAIGTLPQTHVPQHDAWWHISLKPRPDGLATENLQLPGGGLMNGRLDLRSHEVVLQASTGWERRLDARAGRTGTEMAEAVIAAAAELGLEGEYVRKDFEDDGAGAYDEGAVATFWRALTSAAAVFETHRATLDHRKVGPVQFWPHGFDLAFEWFGTRIAEYEGSMYPSQLNLGFYSTGRPYFYSNPFPFDTEDVTARDLPVGSWTTESFEGSRLWYDEVAGKPDGAETVRRYARAVFEAASPTLLIG